ncbi:MAG: hypothetical protein QM802_19970 [Agriterribacter sp.]
MNDTAKALEILKEGILKNKRHQDYPRVTDLSKEYLQLFTGEGIEELLKVFHKKTGDDMFNQVVSVYKSIMPEVANNLAKVFSKIFRSNRIFSSVESKSNTNAQQEIIKYAGATFWSGDNSSGLDAYLASRWFHFQMFDPNAFIAIHFNNVNKVTEKTSSIFPVEYSSTEVMNFSYVNGKLDWLIVELPHRYRVKVGNGYSWKDGKRYIMYLDNDAIQLTEVDPQQRITTASDEDAKAELEVDVNEAKSPEFIELKPTVVTANIEGSTGRVFQYETFNHKGGAVPAKRVGYDLDPVTDQRTCVSIFHAALPRFKKELKAGSELDLAIALHLHPQKVQFADPCEGDTSKGMICKDGKAPNGDVCVICHGSGMKSVSTSSQDIIFVRRPRPDDPWPDLTKYVHYVKTDVEVIKFLYDLVNEITEKAKRAIFGAQAVEKKTVDKTATEMDYSYDDVYDTLHPFGMSYSSFWVFSVTFIAIFSDNKTDDLIIYHRFPKDFKLKTLGELMDEAKVASASGLPQHIIDAINRDIAEILYSDDQDTLSKIKIKNRFYPFAGKSQAEISQIILQNKTTKFNQTLYVHFNEIFEGIDDEIGNDFYIKYSYEKQKATIKEKVDAITALIDGENEVRLKLEASIQPDNL